MIVKVDEGDLVIRIPLQEPTPSANGKTLVVATSHGFKKTDATVGGKPVIVVATACIER